MPAVFLRNVAEVLVNRASAIRLKLNLVPDGLSQQDAGVSKAPTRIPKQGQRVQDATCDDLGTCRLPHRGTFCCDVYALSIRMTSVGVRVQKV